MILQQQTFVGFKQVKECTDLRLKQLEELTGMINGGADYILDYIKDEKKPKNVAIYCMM